MPTVLGSCPMDEELCCEVESVDFWVVVEGEGGPLMTVEALETKVVWATGGQEALLKIGPPLSFEGKVLSSFSQLDGTNFCCWCCWLIAFSGTVLMGGLAPKKTGG